MIVGDSNDVVTVPDADHQLRAEFAEVVHHALHLVVAVARAECPHRQGELEAGRCKVDALRTPPDVA